MVHPRTRAFCLVIISLMALSFLANGQSPAGDSNKKVEIAVERSKAATEVLTRLAALPEGKGIPKEIAEKMNMLGVVPDVFQLSLLFSRGIRGHGMASIKHEGSWSLPSYFFFGKSNGFDLSSVGKKNFDVIVAVVNARTDVSKPSDKSSRQPRDKSDKPQVHAFSFADGELKPLKVKVGVLSALSGAAIHIAEDGSLNKAIYGVKNGADIVLGKIDSAKQLPPEISAFRDTLAQLFPVK